MNVNWSFLSSFKFFRSSHSRRANALQNDVAAQSSCQSDAVGLPLLLLHQCASWTYTATLLIVQL
jgi:hypothetical protein